MSIRSPSGLVIKCFKRVEAFADWLTGAAGPVFVFLCWMLTVAGGSAFFDVILLRQSYLTQIIFVPPSLLIALNMYGHYYWAWTVSPGVPSLNQRSLNEFPQDGVWWGTKRGGRLSWRGGGGVKGTESERARLGEGDERDGWSGSQRSHIQVVEKAIRKCRKCSGPKPDRAHHCSVCKKCIALMDHHCPWLNQCVGLHNQRHFILFMFWLSVSCWCFSIAGFNSLWISLEHRPYWPALITPQIGFTLIYVLAVAIGLAVPVLMFWHIYLVAKGQTSIEAHDNEYFEKKAKERGMIYVNPYDLGYRRNLELFFNVGPEGYPLHTLLLPLRIPPYTAGWKWELHPAATRPGGPPEGVIVGDEEGLTDDEEGGGGFVEQHLPVMRDLERNDDRLD